MKYTFTSWLGLQQSFNPSTVGLELMLTKEHTVDNQIICKPEFSKIFLNVLKVSLID
jgi:hypothetical protein